MAARKRATAPQPKKNKDALWRVAVHEAGHAVAAHALGIALDDMRIVPGTTAGGDEYAGRTSLVHAPHDMRRALDDSYDIDEDARAGSSEEETLIRAAMGTRSPRHHHERAER